jgi:hypothetical protein
MSGLEFGNSTGEDTVLHERRKSRHLGLFNDTHV